MASRSLGQLTIDILTRTGAFEQGMDRAARTADRKSREIERYSQRSAQSVQQAWSIAGAAIQGAIAGISVGAVFTAFIRETINAQNEQAQLATVLRSTGEAAGYSAQQLNAMADALESATAFSAGEITEAQTTLLAFTGIVGQEFPRALQAAADMAARTGMTVKAAAETIGRALDVPSQGLTSLSRQGFRFTAEQKALAEQLEATGRTAEAQAIVLGALEESYGGAAEAARDTLGGALAALRNTVASLLTGSDDGIRGLRDAVEGLNDALRSEGARDALEALAVTAQIVAGVFVTRVAASVAASGVAFAAATLEAGRYQAALARMAGVSATTAAGLGALGAAARVASSALALVGGPIGAVILAVGGAAYAWREYSSSARDSASESVRSVTEIKGSVDDLVESYRALNELQREQVIGIKEEDLALAIREARSAVIDLGNAFTPALSQGTKAAATFRAQFTSEIKAIAADSEQSSEQMAQALSGVIQKYIESGRASEENRSKLVDLALKVVEAAGSVNGLTKELEALANAQQAAAGGVGPVVDNLEQYRRNYEKFLKDFATPQERFKAAVEEQKRLLGELYGPDVERRLRDRFLPRVRSAPSSNAGSGLSEIQRIVEELDQQRATLGMTEAAAGRYRIEIAKGAETDRARALAIYDQIQAWKEAKIAIDQAAESSRYITAINRELELFQRQQDIEIAGVGMGDRQREGMERELAVRLEYAERRRQLEEAQQVESTRLAQDQYEARIEALQDAEERQIEILQDGAIRKREAESSWLNGMNRSLQNYVDNVSNVSQQVDDLFTNAFQNAEDALVNFIMTGELDLENLVRGIGEELIRMLVRLGLQMAANAVLGQTFATASTAMATATGAAMASAYAPAAALASLASFGANAAPATAGLVSTVGIAQGLAFAGLFDEGGVIPAGKWGIAGELGPEIIEGPARVTSRVDTANILSRPQGGLTVNLIENPDRAGQVDRRTTDSGDEEADIFVADIFGDGRRSRAMQQAFGLRRVGR